LSLELIDSGVDLTLLHDFRCRMLAHEAGQQCLDTFLAACNARGWLKVRGTQRTDSTLVLAAIHTLHRLPCALEAMPYALNHLSDVAPAWVRQHVPPELVHAQRSPVRSSALAEGYEYTRGARPSDRGRWHGCGLRLPPSVGRISSPWRRCGGFGSSSITAVPSQGRKSSAGAPETSNRPRRYASPTPMTSKRATVVSGTPTGWAIRCISPRPAISASLI
jgi:hypothetical protein